MFNMFRFEIADDGRHVAVATHEIAAVEQHAGDICLLHLKNGYTVFVRVSIDEFWDSLGAWNRSME